MTPIQSILMPIVPAQQPAILENAVLLASWLRSELHIITEETQLKKVRVQLKQIIQKTGKDRELLPHPSVQAWTENLLPALFGAIADYSADLVLLSIKTAIRGILSEQPLIEKDILQECPVPFLLVPKQNIFYKGAIESFLVAMSGERKSDNAVELALRLASRTRIPVDIVHVTPHQGPLPPETAVLHALKDQFHHEHPKLVEHLIAQACPLSSARERQYIRYFLQSRGLVTDEISKVIEAHPKSIIVLEWKGIADKGRAGVLRQVLSQSLRPVFLTKARPPAKTHLKVGERFGK